jgi:uncharacterized protein YaeQ
VASRSVRRDAVRRPWSTGICYSGRSRREIGPSKEASCAMALGATIYSFNIDLANADRGVYQQLELRVARHPSESEAYFLTRVLAYCFEYDEGISFSNGLFEPDEPTIAIRDLTGLLRVWIDVGVPEAARLHRASKASPRVVAYTHKDPRQLVTRLAGERIHRVEALELYALDPEWLTTLAARLARRMTFSLTIAEQHVYLTLGADTLPCAVEKIFI